MCMVMVVEVFSKGGCVVVVRSEENGERSIEKIFKELVVSIFCFVFLLSVNFGIKVLCKVGVKFGFFSY